MSRATRRQSTPVGIIDERIAKLMWPGESAIGKRYRVAPHLMKTPWFEIVGVVGHIRHDALDVDTRAQAYWPATQRAQDRMALVVRTERNASALAASVVRAIHEIDPEQPVYDVRTMDEWVDRSLGQRWMNMTLVGDIRVGGADALRDRRLRRDRVRRRASAARVRHPPRARREPARHRVRRS